MTKSPLGIKGDDVFIRFTERTQEQGTFFYNLIYLPTSLFLFWSFIQPMGLYFCVWIVCFFVHTHSERESISLLH